jgi:hypothetical protein
MGNAVHGGGEETVHEEDSRLRMKRKRKRPGQYPEGAGLPR